MDSKLLAAFEQWLTESGRKRSTVVYYLKNITTIYKKAQHPINKDNFLVYIASLLKNNYSSSYYNDHIVTMRVWGKFIHTTEFDDIKQIKERSKVKATMSDSEIEAFLSLPPRRNGPKENWYYNKYTLFYSIMAYTGMRPGEVAHLQTGNVDFGRSIFVLEDTKTNTPRFVPIPPNLTETLRQYILVLKTDYLFPSPQGGNKDGFGPVIDNVDWYYNFHQRLKRLGIKRSNLTVYSLRHSFITRMLEEDVNIFKVQKIVGHKRLETTAIYTHMTTKDMQNAIAKHPLIRKSTDPKQILRSIIEVLKAFSLENDPRFTYQIDEREDSLSFNLRITSLPDK